MRKVLFVPPIICSQHFIIFSIYICLTITPELFKISSSNFHVFEFHGRHQMCEVSICKVHMV